MNAEKNADKATLLQYQQRFADGEDENARNAQQAKSAEPCPEEVAVSAVLLCAKRLEPREVE